QREDADALPKCSHPSPHSAPAATNAPPRAFRGKTAIPAELPADPTRGSWVHGEIGGSRHHQEIGEGWAAREREYPRAIHESHRLLRSRRRTLAELLHAVGHGGGDAHRLDGRRGHVWVELGHARDRRDGALVSRPTVHAFHADARDR